MIPLFLRLVEVWKLFSIPALGRGVYYCTSLSSANMTTESYQSHLSFSHYQLLQSLCWSMISSFTRHPWCGCSWCLVSVKTSSYVDVRG